MDEPLLQELFPNLPAPAPSPGLAPPGLAETLEYSWKLLFSPTAAFHGLGTLPAPGLGLSTVNLVIWSATAFAVNLIRFLLTDSAALGLVQMLPLLFAMVLGLFLVIPMGFFAGAFLHLLSMLSGGRSSFSRSYQIVSLLSVVAPLTAAAAAAPHPMAWAVPAAYGTFLAASAVSGMQFAPFLQALVVFGGVGAVALAGALQVQRHVRRFQDALASLQTAAAQLSPEQNPAMGPQAQAGDSAAQTGMPEQMQKMTEAAMGALQSVQGPASGRQAQPRQIQELQQLMKGAAAALGQSGLVPQSSLDLLMKAQSGQKLSPEETSRLRQTGQSAIGQVQAIMNDPKTSQEMTPQELQQLQQMRQMISSLAMPAKAGAQPSGPDIEQMLGQLQRMASEVQEQNAGPAAANQDASHPPAPRHRPPPPPPDE